MSQETQDRINKIQSRTMTGEEERIEIIKEALYSCFIKEMSPATAFMLLHELNTAIHSEGLSKVLVSFELMIYGLQLVIEEGN